MCKKMMSEKAPFHSKCTTFAFHLGYICNAIRLQLTCKCSPFAMQRSSYWRVEESPTLLNTIKNASEISKTKFLFVIIFYCMYDICMVKTCFRLDFGQLWAKNATFLKLFRRNSCMEQLFVIPLHPLSRTNETSSKTRLSSVREAKKKEFFEKIYINRQVVQEASLTLFIMCRFG